MLAKPEASAECSLRSWAIWDSASESRSESRSASCLVLPAADLASLSALSCPLSSSWTRFLSPAACRHGCALRAFHMRPENLGLMVRV